MLVRPQSGGYQPTRKMPWSVSASGRYRSASCSRCALSTSLVPGTFGLHDDSYSLADRLEGGGSDARGFDEDVGGVSSSVLMGLLDEYLTVDGEGAPLGVDGEVHPL